MGSLVEPHDQCWSQWIKQTQNVNLEVVTSLGHLIKRVDCENKKIPTFKDTRMRKTLEHIYIEFWKSYSEWEITRIILQTTNTQGQQPANFQMCGQQRWRIILVD